ncbi:feruloyl CoA ortho-hydroxylase 2-like [Tripterygium wilfordii]|uniref:Feruloyl CoA ortho-hydroxylase 2-like n=1 Tax=Tripterygium wilfordii TaxID=458696 RepID=A0A7J7DZY7_TRIWF|nr:feruloyl CoA ortho-hydroxylase 2-like [Tripterygium wilfordii]
MLTRQIRGPSSPPRGGDGNHVWKLWATSLPQLHVQPLKQKQAYTISSIMELLKSMKSAVHEFFGLPNEERRKYWKGQSVLLKSLDVEEIDKAKEYALMGSVFVNLNYYPHCLNPELTAGIG